MRRLRKGVERCHAPGEIHRAAEITRLVERVRSDGQLLRDPITQLVALHQDPVVVEAG